MAGVHTFFSSLHHFFGLLWASILGLFSSERGVGVNSCDIEAGIQPSTALKEAVIDVTYDSKPAACFLIPVKDSFVEIDLNSQPATSSTSSGRPARHTLPVDPVKSRIVDTALKQVQDRTINVIKSVIVSPGTVTTTPCSAKVEHVNLHIIGPSNAQIRLSKQSFAELSIISTDDLDCLPTENESVKTASVKTFVLPRIATIRYVRSLPQHKLRAVQFALPPIEIPDIFGSRKAVKRKRNSDLFDLLDQFPSPPAHAEPILPPPAISPEKSSRFARRYCIYRKASPGDESTSSSESDATVLSISVSGDTLECAALETPSTANFSSSAPVPKAVEAGEDPFLYSSRFVPQVQDEMYDSPTRVFTLSSMVHNHSHRLSLAVDPARLSKSCVSHDIELDLGHGEDFNSAEKAGFGFFWQQFRSMLSTSPSDGSDTTVDQLRAQPEEPVFDSIKRPHSPVWFADHSLTRDFKNYDIGIASHLVVEKTDGEENTGFFLLESLPGEEYLEDVLKTIRESEVEDLDFRELFCQDSSFFCRSSLANRVNLCSTGVTGPHNLKHCNDSLESADKSIEEMLAILNPPDPIGAATEDSTWAFSSDEMANILSLAEIGPAVSNAGAMQRGDPQDIFTWITMNLGADEDFKKEENSSEAEDDQWHDAVLDLDAF